MDGIASLPGGMAMQDALSSVNLALLKKSQDLVQTQALALLEALPETRPMSPNSPGIGGHVDVSA